VGSWELRENATELESIIYTDFVGRGVTGFSMLVSADLELTIFIIISGLATWELICVVGP
jgi:hypothetical protein